MPVPSQKSYQLQLIDKTECTIKRMRWKAPFFQNDAAIIIIPATKWLKKHTGSSPNITLANAKS